MNIILIIILILILIILIILNNGLKINTKYEITNESLNIVLKVTILNIKIFKKTIPSKEEKKEDKEDKDSKFNLKELINLLKENKNLIKKILKIFKNSTKIEKLENHINIGLEDYVETSEIVGILYSINSILNLKDNILLTTEANFNEEINIKGKLIFKINLLKFLLKIITDKKLLKFIKQLIGVIR